MTTLQETIGRSKRFSYVTHRVQAQMAAVFRMAGEVRRVVGGKLGGGLDNRKACADRAGSVCVLHLIRNSGRGVHPAVLARVTGYEQRKLDRILHKLFKHGAIMIEAGGIYAPTRAELFQTRRVH